MKKNKHSIYQDVTNTGSIERKQALKKMGKAIKKLAAYSAPFMAAKAFTEEARATDQEAELVRMLNILLQMEYVLELYYLIAVYDNELVPSPYGGPINSIKRHHHDHVVNVKNIIRKLDTNFTNSPQLDANFNTDHLDPGGNFDDYLMIAQVLEDASTSLYKKFTPKISAMGIRDFFVRNLFRTHSTEARHAAYIRAIRAERGEDVRPWISSTSDNAVRPSMQNIYINEANTIQHEIDVASVASVPPSFVQEAWDEPCNNDPINDLFALFQVNYY